MSVLQIAAVIAVVVIVAAFVIDAEIQRRRWRRARALYDALLPDDDPRIVPVAMFYGASLDWVRLRIARGHRIGFALGYTLLFPPASPRPPAKSE